jgi:hypothetical protein
MQEDFKTQLSNISKMDIQTHAIETKIDSIQTNMD